MTQEEILKLVEQEDVEFIRLQFTDICGNLKNRAVTSEQLVHVLNHKCAFDGSALYGEGYGSCEDLYLAPDLDTFVILPWRPQQGKVARFLCDIFNEDGERCRHSPRRILASVLDKAREKGYEFYVYPECEFFLYHTDENGIATTITHDCAGYMDVGPLDLGENARRDMVLTLEEMGFQIESSHHEKAPSQHEIDFKAKEALSCADSIVTFRSAVRSIGKRFGLHATFMPKPREDVAGSGMHLNLSVYRKGQNLLEPREGEAVTEEAKYLIGGIMEHARALCAITNPLVNSYKRLVAGFGAPKDIVWSREKCNGLIRIQKPLGEDTRLKLRFPDGAANPYLALAACITAAMDGVERKLLPGAYAPDCYREGQKIEILPVTLYEAVACFEQSALMQELFGPELIRVYSEMKRTEWNGYMQHVSEWERNQYLYRV